MVVDGQSVYPEGSGFEDPEEGRPLTDESLFGIGSVVMTFTSALIGTLIDDDFVSVHGRPGD